MKPSLWALLGRFAAGAASALLLGWLAVALMVGLDILVSDFSTQPIFVYLVLPALAFHLAAAPLIGFGMSWVCAFFWRSIFDRVTSERWGTPVVLIFFAPALLLGSASFITLALLFPLIFPFVIAPFHRGINISFDWWHEGRWRHFAGLANDWERDENKTS